MSEKSISIKERPKVVSSIKERPTFYIDGFELRAGGVLFYRTIQDKKEILMIKKGERWEDIGGKTDIGDTCIEDTVAREVDEETNSVIKKQYIRKQLDTGFPVYSATKYVLYFIKANQYERKLCTEDFGTTEFVDNICRTLHWISLENVKTITLHPRLSLQSILSFFK
jgi:8-oxo-dGTP pyrophosphatase MutT (NUDIX family)